MAPAIETRNAIVNYLRSLGSLVTKDMMALLPDSSQQCECGHMQFYHNDKNHEGCSICWQGYEPFSVRYKKAVHNFKLDNLRYLEIEQERRAK